MVVTPGGEQATLVALNKKTGAVIWKSAVPGGDPAGYACHRRSGRRSQAICSVPEQRRRRCGRKDGQVFGATRRLPKARRKWPRRWRVTIMFMAPPTASGADWSN